MLGEPRRWVHGKLEAVPHAGRWARLLAAAALVCLPVLAAPWISRALMPPPREFNSDLAIPVLMMRAGEWSLFDVYYWGQDRLGTWHLLLLRAASQLSGRTFDYAALHLVGTAWALMSAVVMARLAGAWGWAAGGLMAAVVVGNSDSRFRLFDAAHPYAWQITALMLAWWGLRTLADRPSPAGRWPLRAATACAVFLAHWTSPLSGPLLLIVAGIEAVRARALDAAPGRSLLRRLGEGGLVVFTGMVGERVLRAAFDSYAHAEYGQYFRTGVVLDKENLANNAGRAAKALAASASMPLLVVATAGACAAAVVLWRAVRGGRMPSWRVEGAALVLACWAIAAAQLPVFVLVRHVRVNDFHLRYFSLVFVFGTLAGLLTLAGLAASLPALSRRWRQVLALAGAAGLAVGVLRVPPATGARPEGLARVAARLEAQAPSAPLLGGYWSTYVFAALQRPGTMQPPVPCEGRMVRTPWWAGELRRHRWVVVVGNTYECPDAGSRASPAPWVYQHGALLRLARPGLAGGTDVSFALYENANARALAHTAQPVAAAWRYCEAGAALRLSFPARQRAQVMLARVAKSPAAILLAAPIFADGRVGPAVRMLATGRLHRAELRADGALLVGARITVQHAAKASERQTCMGANTFLVGE